MVKRYSVWRHLRQQKEVIMTKRGLVLFIGATGSGKSTSLAALIDYRNENSSGHIITIEDGVIKGGFGSSILEFASENNYSIPIKCLGIPDEFIEHGKIEELQEYLKLDSNNLKKIITQELSMFYH